MIKLKSIPLGELGANLYLLSNEKREAVLIDIGADGERVADYVRTQGLRPLGILLTHGHFDHCGGVADFVKIFPVPVYGHSADRRKAQTAAMNFFGVSAENCEMTDFVDSCDPIRLGDFVFSVMHTPGHTSGSVCYFTEDLMFSGDTLFHGSVGRTDLEDGDPEKLKESLLRILEIKKNYRVFPGHDEQTTLDFEKKYNPYLSGKEKL